MWGLFWSGYRWHTGPDMATFGPPSGWKQHHDQPQETPADDDETERVARWRYDQLVEAGWPDGHALLLANNTQVDLHQAIQLLQDGCTIDTAWQILT